MIRSQGDSLLTAARVLVILILVILGLGLIGVTVGIGFLLTVGQDEVWSRIAAADAPDVAFQVLIGAFALIVIWMAIAIAFFQTLHRIVISVDRGHPFDPVNAERLRAMGWSAVAGQLVLVPLGAIVTWLTPYLERLGEDVDVDLGLDPSAILLILILFILARVFARGATMQHDLEGTV